MDDWELQAVRIRPSLLAAARRRLAYDDAVDAVDETTARAWAGRAALPPDVGLDAWMHGILRNVVRERCRRQAPTVVDFHDNDDGPAVDSDPASAVVRAEAAAFVWSALARLDRSSQQVLVLRFHHGMTSREIGAVQRRDAAAVRMAQTRALRRLRLDLPA